MNVTQAVLARKTIRSFLDRPVERALVEEILALAARAPSGGNVQPWRVDVVAGPDLALLKDKVRQGMAAGLAGEGRELGIYPKPLEEPYRSRRFDIGELLYASIGIAREDKAGRRAQFARNYEAFGAPIILFLSIDRAFDRPQWAHLGMFMQNLMLLARERGLGTCALEAWAAVAGLVSRHLALPKERIFYCGIALGYADEAHPINGFTSPRARLDDYVTFRGM